MRLLKLHVDRVPGITTPFDVTAGNGVNLVLGPNESGKSTVVKTVLHLLWPTDISGAPLEVEGHFSHNKKTLVATSNFNNTVGWTEDGNEADRPALPSGHVESCYRLGVHDLVRPHANGLDNDLAQEIRIRMAGGYDLDRLTDLIPDPSRSFSTRRSTWIKKKQDLQSIIQIQKSLSEDQSRLPGLKKEAERAVRAQKREQLFEQAIKLEETKQSIAGMELRLGQYAPGMKNLREDDGTNLANYYEELKTSQKLYKEQQDLLDKKNRLLKDLGLTEESNQCNTGLVDKILEKCKLLWNTKLELGRAISGAKNKMVEEEKHIDPQVRAFGSASEMSPGQLFKNLSRMYKDIMTLEAAHEESKKQMENNPLQSMALDNETEQQQIREAAEAISRAVDDYLALGSDQAPSRSLWLWGALALIVGAGGFFPTVFNPLAILPSILSLVAGSTLVFKGIRINKRNAARRLSLQRECEDAGHPLPASWTEKQAREKVTELESKVSRTEAGQEARKILQKEQADSLANNEEKLKQALEQRRQTLKDHNLPESMEPEDLLAAINSLDRYFDARNFLADNQGQLEVYTKEIEAAHNQARQEFAKGNIEVAASIEALEDALKQLIEKRKSRDTLQSDLDEGQNQLQAFHSSVEHQKQQRQQLLDRLSLPNDNDAQFAVATLIKDQKQYLAFQNSLDAANLKRSHLLQELASGTEALPTSEWDDLTIVELSEKQQEESELAGRARTLADTIVAIETRIHDTRKNHALADAQADEQSSHQHVVELYEKRNEAALASVLVQETIESFEHNSRPRILEQASLLFENFTGNRYQLRVATGQGNNGNQTFQALAKDGSGQALALEELSDGTRTQLLLAARLAFIKESETGVQLPVFLDESLTSSDPARFASIAVSLAKWSQESSRQIFYLTSNPADVAAWIKVLEDENLEAPNFIDLGAIRTGSMAANPDSFLPPCPAKIPDPAGLSAAEYGAALKIPKLNPWATENAASLYYFLRDDLQLLHNLLEAGTTSFGPWNSLSPHLVQGGIITTGQQQKLNIRGQILGAYLEAWRVGRGRILRNDDLKKSEIFSKRMLERAAEFLEEVQGNATEFLEGALTGSVTGMRKEPKKALQVFLEREGFIDTLPVLEFDQIISHIVQVVASELEASVINLDDIRNLATELEKTLREQ